MARNLRNERPLLAEALPLVAAPKHQGQGFGHQAIDCELPKFAKSGVIRARTGLPVRAADRLRTGRREPVWGRGRPGRDRQLMPASANLTQPA